MKSISLTCLLALFLSASLLAVNSPTPVSDSNGPVMGMMVDGQQLTINDILDNKPRDLAKKYNVDLSLKERFALSLVRGKLKKAKRKGLNLEEAYADAAGSSSFHVGGFILGFFLGLLGWLLAILIWPNMGAGKSALLGFAIWLIILALFVF